MEFNNYEPNCAKLEMSRLLIRSSRLKLYFWNFAHFFFPTEESIKRSTVVGHKRRLSIMAAKPLLINCADHWNLRVKKTTLQQFPSSGYKKRLLTIWSLPLLLLGFPPLLLFWPVILRKCIGSEAHTIVFNESKVIFASDFLRTTFISLKRRKYLYRVPNRMFL